MLQVIRAQDAMQFIFQIKVYWQLNCHIKYLPFRVKNYSKYGSPPIKYMSLPIRPPYYCFVPLYLSPPIWGGTSPPPYHQGLGKTLPLNDSETVFSVCKTRAQEDKSNTFHLHFDYRALKRCQQNYHSFYMFSFAIHVRNMDMVDQATWS